MAALGLPVLIIVGYLLVFVIIGAYEYRRSHRSDPTEYFLAGRGLGTIVLTMTIMATVLSAFTYVGLPGFAYASGLSTWALPTATMAAPILMYFVGVRVWKWSREHEYISPPELFRDRYENEYVGILFLVVMIIFVIPYIALQPMVGGLVFEVVSAGDITRELGILITVLVMTAYVFVAGMRGVAWTDTLQGALMFIFMIAAIILLAAAIGGSSAIASELSADPARTSAPGSIGFWTLPMILSWMLLIPGSTALQPQILVRFMSARSESTLRRSIIGYAILATLLGFFAVILGSLAAIQYPGLDTPDEAFIIVTTDLLTPALAALFLGGVLSALISTADSQLLVLSQMLTRDGYLPYVDPDATPERQALVGRAVILVLGVLGGGMALIQPQFIFTFAGVAFAGIAVLTPVILAALYWKRSTASAAIGSIIVGELIVSGFALGIIPAGLKGPFHEIVPAMIAAIVVLVGLSYVTATPSAETIEKFFPGSTTTPAPSQPDVTPADD